MKRLLMLLGFMTIGASAWASGNAYSLPVSSGSNYRAVDMYSNSDGFDRQAIVFGDATTSATVHVDPIQGAQVYLGTGTAIAGSFILSQPFVVGATVTYNGTQQVNVGTLYQPSVIGATVTYNGTQQVNVGTLYQPSVIGATVTYNGTQQVTVGTLYQPSVIGATVTFNGTQNVQLQTGTNAVGTVVISSANGVSGSTIAVTNAGGVALKVDNSAVTQPVSGALRIDETNILGATVTFNGTQTVNVATGGVTAAQGGTWTVQPGNTQNTTAWIVQVATGGIDVTRSTVTIMAPNNNTTAIPVSGSFTASSVNITTAAPNGAMPTAIQIIGGVNASGLAQSFAVDTSSKIQISGSFSATAVSVTTAVYNTTMPGYGGSILHVGPTGLAQSPLVDVSSNTMVKIIQANVLGATVTYNGTQQVNVGTLYQPSVIGATVTYNGTQQVNVGTLYQPSVIGATVTYNGTQTVNVATGGVTAAQIGTWTVNVATGGVTAAQIGTWTVNVATGGITAAQIGTWTVQPGNTPNTADWHVTLSTAVTSPRVLVSSNTTLPATTADAGQVQVMGDNEGRIVTQAGVPTAVIQSTQPAAISGTGYIVLVASPSSTIFTHMCGCTLFNTSATDTYVTFYPSGNSTTSNFFRVGAPKANFTNGIWPGCDKPFMNTTSGGVQVTVTAAASVSNLYIQCQYYQSTSP